MSHCPMSGLWARVLRSYRVRHAGKRLRYPDDGGKRYVANALRYAAEDAKPLIAATSESMRMVRCCATIAHVVQHVSIADCTYPYPTITQAASIAVAHVK